VPAINSQALAIIRFVPLPALLTVRLVAVIVQGADVEIPVVVYGAVVFGPYPDTVVALTTAKN